MKNKNQIPEESALPLGEILLSRGVLSAEELRVAREKAESSLLSLEDVLRKEKRITDELMQKTLEDHLHSLLPNAERSKPAIRHETSAIFRGRAALPSPQPLQQVRDVLARRALLRAARRAENALLRQKRREASAENVQESVEVPAPRAPLIRSLVQRLQRAQKLRKAKTTETQKEVSQKMAKVAEVQEEQAPKNVAEEEAQKNKEAELAKKEAERQAKIEEEKRVKEEARKKKEEERARKEAERQAKIEEEKRLKEEARKKKEAERLKKEEERKQREEQKKREAEEQKRKKEEEARARAAEKEKQRLKKEQEKSDRIRRKAEQKAERVRNAILRRAARAERRKALLLTMQTMFIPHRRPKETGAEERQLIDEARKEAFRQVLIEHEKQKFQSGEQAMTLPQQQSSQQETGRSEGIISTILVDSPDRVVVSAPRHISQESATGDHTGMDMVAPLAERDKQALFTRIRELEAEVKSGATAPLLPEEERAQLQNEKNELLKQIEELKKNGASVQASSTNLTAEREALEKERQALAEERQRLQSEKPSPTRRGKSDFAEERAEFQTEKNELLQKIEELKKAATAQVPSEEKSTPSPDKKMIAAIEAEFEKKLKEKEVEFAMEKKEWEKLIEEKLVAEKGIAAKDEALSKKDRERDRFQAMKDAQREAETSFEKERTQWAIEKERIRQQAIAEAEAGFLSKMKEGSGFLGVRHRDTLTKEIGKWQKEAEKLAEERRALERQRVLHEEEQRMREEKRKVEEERVHLEREKVADEKLALESEEEHAKRLKEEEKQLEEERKELKAVEKSKKQKAKKKKKGEKGEQKVEVKPSLDIGQILVAQNYLEQAEYEAARKSAEERNVTLDHVLREEGLLTKDIIQNAVAEHYHMPFVDVGTNPPATDIVELLPSDIALGQRITAIEKKGDDTIVVATCNPEQGDSLRAQILEAVPGITNVEFVYTTRDAIDAALAFYRKPLNTRFQQIIDEHKKIAPEIIEEIFADAIQLGASDIHFEPQEKIIIVRFRVDGVMHEAGKLPREYYEGIVNRIKIAGNMRIDEHFAAQDGAIRWKHGDKAMDVRVSIVPIVDGEKIVMRLLSEYVRTLTLRDLGFAPRHLDTLMKNAHKPFGMILTTGPTGSGKSTTLYGLMKIRNSPDVNISTIEDPVEYKIPGINHIQVNVKANLTFERGLRALVRQDPDIILVGEIRDDITAQISVNAALTGHLLFSTLHANDAATAVPRLLEMGIESYLLASTLELIIAQRLMRRVCMNCRYSYKISLKEAQKLFMGAERYFTEGDEVTLYRGKGCAICGNTGYKGRVGVYEMMAITAELEEMITNRRTSGEINVLARKQGMLTLFEDGLEKVLAGLSNMEELLRVAAPPDLLDSTPSINYEALLEKE